ncbi:MAG: polyribonucleotide nucleotidyltransferase, partial [Rhodoluna sp.]
MEGPEIKATEAIIDNGKFGKRVIRFETGRLAQQAQGAAAVYIDEETMLFSATTASKQPKDQFDFFPLTIDVEERMYAAGRIPGSFFRREGRPSTEAILACRLIDRPLRPSFVDGLRNEIQVVVTVWAIEPDELYDVVAINAASMSTQLAGLPFSGPIGGVRVALIDGQWVAFPKYSQLERAVFNMVVAGRVIVENGVEDVAIMMVEAEASENSMDLIAAGAKAPSEDVVSEGLEAAKPFIKALVKAQADLAAVAAKPTSEYPTYLPYSDEVYAAVEAAAGAQLAKVYQIADKVERQDADDALKAETKAALESKLDEAQMAQFSAAYKSVTKKIMRTRVLKEGIRIDGRGLKDIRQITAETHPLPRVHGSAIFQRGETQILGVTTLNMLKMEQQIDSLSPVTSKRYMHNYNFPPYSTGEVGRVGTPKRREIGHGALAERALVPVLPK